MNDPRTVKESSIYTEGSRKSIFELSSALREDSRPISGSQFYLALGVAWWDMDNGKDDQDSRRAVVYHSTGLPSTREYARWEKAISDLSLHD